MTLGELLQSLRQMLSDEVEPYQWSTLELTRYLNNAVREACLRARLMRTDADNEPSVCAYDVVAPATPPTSMPQSGRIRLHASIIAIRSAAMLTAPYKLRLVSSDDMDRMEMGWDTVRLEIGQPRYLIVDLAQKVVQLWPLPMAADTLRLRLWRGPLDTELMREPGDKSIINQPDAEELKHWAAHEAYLKKDGENFDENRSNNHLALFEQRFGARPSLHEMRRWADTPPRERFARMF
ncbi:MAG: hypothetical protein WA777_12700 [Rhodanobacter sp.]